MQELYLHTHTWICVVFISKVLCICFIIRCVYVCVCVWVLCVSTQYLWKMEMGIKFPGSAVANGCDPPIMGAGIKTPVFVGEVRPLIWQASDLAL